MLGYELLLALIVFFFTQNVSNLRERCGKHPFFVNLHKLFCDKTVVDGCVDAGLHKVLIRYPNPVLVVNTVDECLSKWSVVEERLEWKIIFSSFDGCKSTLNDWKNPSSSVDARCERYCRTCSEPVCCLDRRRGSLI